MDTIIASLVSGLQHFFGSNYLAIFFISMVPMVEVRGAIPLAIGMGISSFYAFLFSTLSALIIAPILLFFLAPILNALKKNKIFKKIAHAIEDMFRGKAKKINDKSDNMSDADKIKYSKKIIMFKMLGLFLFVAIPLPLTGVWTGAAVAVFINLKVRYSLPAIAIGNFFAGGLITIMSVLLGNKSFIILIVLFVFILISIASIVITLVVKNKKKALVTKSTEAITYTDPLADNNEKKDI